MGLGPRILLGGAALLFSLLVVVASAAPPTAAVPAQTARDKVKLSIGRDGWRPASVETHKGARIQFIVRADEGEHCFAIDAFRVEKRVVAGRETRIDVVPDQVGTFPYYDCLADGGRRVSGRLVVTD